MSRPPFWRIPRNSTRDDDPDAESSSALVRNLQQNPSPLCSNDVTGQKIKKQKYRCYVFNRDFSPRVNSFVFFLY